MEHALVMADGDLVLSAHLPKTLRGLAAPPAGPMRDTLEETERQAIVAALATEKENRTRAAKRLGISRRALIYKMIKYGLR